MVAGNFDLYIFRPYFSIYNDRPYNKRIKPASIGVQTVSGTPSELGNCKPINIIKTTPRRIYINLTIQIFCPIIQMPPQVR